MSTLWRVDPQLAPYANAWPMVEFTRELLPAFRAAMQPAPEPEGDGVGLERRTMAGPPGAPDLRISIHRKPGLPAGAPAVLYLHGGGYIVGAPENFSFYQRMLAGELDCVVISTSYRLAPESPFPAAVEDAYAALCWIHDNADELGIDRQRVAIFGDSAGGGLAAALALWARGRGGPQICFQALLYPMIDDRESDNPATGEFVVNRTNDAFSWGCYLGMQAGSAEVPAGAVPAREQDLTGLPPGFIITGELDLFVDSNIAYANRLSRAGVPTGLLVMPGAYHGFDQSAPDAEASKLAMSTLRFALQSAFTRPLSPPA